jgi:hypothetical protein
MPMYYFTFHAVPINAQVPPSIVGAYVNCWVQDSFIEKAEITARRGIENNGWGITGYDSEPYQTSREQWLNSDKLEYYEQALIDREVWLFHMYEDGEEE